MTIRRYLKLAILGLTSFVVFTTCKDDEVKPREYPRVKTLEVSQITEAGAKFNAEITFPGNGKIIEYGFVWGENENPTIESSEKKILAQDITTGGFTAEISTTLKEDVTYYVRAYAKNDEYLVYGKNVSFISLGSGAPKIIDIIPSTGTLGDTLLITGKNFSYINSTNITRIGSELSIVIESTDSTLQIIVPDKLMAVNSIISVEIQGNASNKDQTFTLLTPILIDFEPKLITWGDTIMVEVNNFPDKSDLLKLRLNGEEYDVNSSFNDKLSFVISNDINKSSSTISFEVGGFELAFVEKLVLKTPEIISVSPDTVTIGEIVNLDVANFHPSDNSFKLYFTYNGYNISEDVEFLNGSASNIELRLPQINYTNEDNILRLNADVGNGAFSVNQNIVIKAPVIQSFAPDVVANTGDEVTIYGKNFGSFPVVEFDLGYNTKLLEVIEATDNEIKVRIPSSVFKNELMTEYIEGRIKVTAFDRTGVSQTELIIDHKTPWTYSDDNGLFDDNDFVWDQRLAFTTWDDDEYGYLIGGRGELKYGITIPYGQEKLNDFWKFNPINSSWTKLQNWPQQDNQEEIIGAFSFNNSIYAFTDNMRALQYESGVWSAIGNTNVSGYRRYFEINNTPYIIAGDSINTFDPISGTMTKIVDFDLPQYCGISSYQYNGKQRIITCNGEEYKFDPMTQQVSFVRTTAIDGPMLESNGHYIILNTSSKALYSFDPVNGQTTLLSVLPITPYSSFIFIYSSFSIDGALYIRAAQNVFLKYDLNF